MKYIDLTHTFENAMPSYPGDPAAEVIQTAQLEKEGHNNFFLKTGMHVGTHMDAPLHMLENAKRIPEMPLEKFFGAGHLIDARNTAVIDKESLKGVPLKPGDIVLVFSAFDKQFGSEEYFEKYPEISEDFAQELVKAKVSIVGLDFPSPDREPWKVHKILLKENILIIENLTNLESLMEIPSFQVVALPAKLNTEAAPVRVVAVVE